MDVSASLRSLSRLDELVIPAPGVIWLILSGFSDKACWVRGFVIVQAVNKVVPAITMMHDRNLRNKNIFQSFRFISKKKQLMCHLLRDNKIYNYSESHVCRKLAI